jgi:hypothetical protein
MATLGIWLDTNLGAADVEVLHLAETGQGLLESIGVNLFGDVLDIAQNDLLLAGAGLSLLVVSTSGLPAGTVVGRGLLGAGLSGRSRGSRGSSGLGSTSGRGSGGSSLGGGSRDGGDHGLSTGLRGDVGPGLREGRSGGRLLLNRSLLLHLLLGNRSGLGGRGLVALDDLSLDGGDRSLDFLLGGSAVGLGSGLGLLNLAIGLLLELFINLRGSGLVGDLRLGGRSGLRDLGGLNDGFSNLLDLLFLVGQVSEDVIENIVAVGLLSQNEGLNELAGRLGLVGDLTNDRDQDVVEGGLGVDVQDAHLAFLEVELLDLIADGLKRRAMISDEHMWQTDP